MATSSFGTVYGYCRVSSKNQEREGSSLEGQRETIARWCSRQGLPEPVFVVEAESASEERSESRHELHSLIDRLKPGDVIVVVAQDRWSRSVSFHLKSLQLVAAKGARFHSISEGLDFGAKENRFTTTILAAVAEQERMRIHERTVKRRFEMQDTGLYCCGLPPFGYERGPRSERFNRNKLRVNEDAQLVREIYDKSRSGLAVNRIVSWLKREHSDRRGWDAKTVLTILRNRVYCGFVKGSDRSWVEGQHEPIVSLDHWEEVQRALDERRKGGRPASRQTQAARASLIGFGRCKSCKALLNRSQSTPRDGLAQCLSYGCAGSDKRKGCSPAWWVRHEQVDAQLDELVLQRFNEIAVSCPPQTPSRVSTQSVMATIARKRERILDLVEAGTIEKHQVAQRLARLAEEERSAAIELKRIEQEERAVEQFELFLLRVKDLKEAWQIADPYEKRSIVPILAEEVLLDCSGKLHIQWKPLQRVVIDQQKALEKWEKVH